MKNWEKDRKDILNKYGIQNTDEIDSQFGKNTLSMDQLHHVSYVIYEVFLQHILEDPSIVLEKELYKDAYKINALLFDLYQKIGGYTDYTGQINTKEVLDKFAEWVTTYPDEIAIFARNDIIKMVKEYQNETSTFSR